MDRATSADSLRQPLEPVSLDHLSTAPRFASLGCGQTHTNECNKPLLHMPPLRVAPAEATAPDLVSPILSWPALPGCLLHAQPALPQRDSRAPAASHDQTQAEMARTGTAVGGAAVRNVADLLARRETGRLKTGHFTTAQRAHVTAFRSLPMAPTAQVRGCAGRAWSQRVRRPCCRGRTLCSPSGGRISSRASGTT